MLQAQFVPTWDNSQLNPSEIILLLSGLNLIWKKLTITYEDLIEEVDELYCSFYGFEQWVNLWKKSRVKIFEGVVAKMEQLKKVWKKG